MGKKDASPGVLKQAFVVMPITFLLGVAECFVGTGKNIYH